MAELLYAVRAVLRSSEEVKAVLHTYVHSDPAAGGRDSESDVLSDRILVVVSHRDEIHGREQGCVFVLKSKSTNNLRVYRVFPICGEFAITMAQAGRRASYVPLDPSMAPQPRSELSLTIHPGSGQIPLTLLTHDVQTLRTALGECKRLKELADPNPTQYTWLKPYASHHHTPRSIFSETPPDLRTTIPAIQLSRTSAGLPAGDDADDMEVIRDAWVMKYARKQARCGFESLTVRLGSFNVNGEFPSQDLSGWVRGRNVDRLEKPLKGKTSPLEVEGRSVDNTIGGLDEASSTPGSASTTKHPPPPTYTDPNPDMLVLGFQELDLSTEALLYSLGTTREDAWVRAVVAGLGEKGVLYEKLASKQLVGMLIVIFVKKTLRPQFSDVRVAEAGAGVLGVMGNKGGTAIRLQYTPPPTQSTPSPAPTTMTFVNSHLAAFDEMVEKRNADYHDLVKRLVFVGEGEGAGWLGEGEEGGEGSASVFESDVLFWMGDLNYRLDLSDDDVRRMLTSGDWPNRLEELLKFDQLNHAKKFKKAFYNFLEAPIQHLPTYRFSPGVPIDSLGYDVKRKPAWTDRILYYPDPFQRLTPLWYGSHPEITMSDHRPVSAEFSIQVNAYDRKRYAAAVRVAFSRVAGVGDVEGGSTSLPVIRVCAESVDFGKISYRRPVVRTVELQNPGKVPCAYRFIPAEPDAHIYPSWLRVEPIAGILLPDEIRTLTLTAFVENRTAARLNIGPRRIDCTLILHTLLGKDHFICVTAEFEYTCFANSLSRLTRLPGPIRELRGPGDLLPQGHSLNAPREIVRLIDWLMPTALDVHDLFITPGDDKLVDTIREFLDTGNDFPFTQDSSKPDIVLAFGDALLQLLGTLAEGLVPVNIHPRCEQVSSRDEAYEVLDTFPLESINVWISITAFLLFIGQQRSKEQPNSDIRSKAKNLAAIFAPILLRDDPDTTRLPISPVAKRNFLLCFIT